METESDSTLYPPKPEEPLDSECCGTGCTPCVFDIYKRQLKKWESECEEIRNGYISKDSSSLDNSSDIETRLNPEKYLSFRLIEILPDTPKSNIYRFSLSPITSDAVANTKISPKNNFCHLGQHIVLKIGEIAKPYTVFDKGVTEDSTEYFDILIRIYASGQLTPLISKLVPDDLIFARGPFGKPFLYESNKFKSIVLLAAGTGIAPMCMIIEKILSNEDDDTRIKLIFCNRFIKSILIKSRLTQWCSFWNFQVVHYISKSSELVETVPYGMVVKFKRFTRTDLQSECLTGNIDGAQFLICGTKSFDKDMVNYLDKSGVPEERYQVF